MVDKVSEVDTKTLVPIAYAIDKFLEQYPHVRVTVDWDRHAHMRFSRQWYQRSVLNELSDVLQIQKVSNKWKCSKERADAIDFKIWREAHIELTGWVRRPPGSEQPFGPIHIGRTSEIQLYSLGQGLQSWDDDDD